MTHCWAYCVDQYIHVHVSLCWQRALGVPQSHIVSSFFTFLGSLTSQTFHSHFLRAFSTVVAPSTPKISRLNCTNTSTRPELSGYRSLSNRLIWTLISLWRPNLKITFLNPLPKWRTSLLAFCMSVCFLGSFPSLLTFTTMLSCRVRANYMYDYDYDYTLSGLCDCDYHYTQ